MLSVSEVDMTSVLNNDDFSELDDDFTLDADVFSSSGYHTFAKVKRYSRERMDELYHQFENYRDRTGEIIIVGPIYYDIDPKGKHYFIYYTKKKKGLMWKIRFCNSGFFVNGEYLTCSVKAIINPKMMVGEKSYIRAADEVFLEDIERIFNEEAKKISPMLGELDQYSLSRVDYCINFDMSEVDIKACALESKEQIALYMMRLISHADIPHHFKREYKNENQFYLRCGSVVINCYWKYADLRDNYPECPDIEKSKDIIRFEIQYKHPKVFSEVKKFKKKQKQCYDALDRELKKLGFYDFEEDHREEGKGEEYRRISEKMQKYSSSERRVLEEMLSNERCTDTIDEYFNKTIGKGDYYTYKIAVREIEAKCSDWDKIVRLKKALEIIKECEGIRSVKNVLKEKELEDFRRSIRELERLNINPVIIPEDWGIKKIPNLLTNFYRLKEEERQKKEMEVLKDRMFKDYIKDCKKRGEDWMK